MKKKNNEDVRRISFTNTTNELQFGNTIKKNDEDENDDKTLLLILETLKEKFDYFFIVCLRFKFHFQLLLFFFVCVLFLYFFLRKMMMI